jgi:hypothetical protein
VKYIVKNNIAGAGERFLFAYSADVTPAEAVRRKFIHAYPAYSARIGSTGRRNREYVSGPLATARKYKIVPIRRK